MDTISSDVMRPVSTSLWLFRANPANPKSRRVLAPMNDQYVGTAEREMLFG
jgi:hypothetical protein